MPRRPARATLHIRVNRFGTRGDAAGAVAFLGPDRAPRISGACISVDGGRTRLNL